MKMGLAIAESPVCTQKWRIKEDDFRGGSQHFI